MWRYLTALMLSCGGCAMSRDCPMDVDLKPLRGLWKSTNEIAAPPGSCKTLNNCCIRKPGVIEPLPDWKSQGYAAADVPRRMWDIPDTDTKDDILMVRESSGGVYSLYWVGKASGTAVNVQLDSADPSYEEGVAQVAQYRGRVYLTTKSGLIVMDSAGDATARRAGLAAPARWNQLSATTSDAQAIEPNKFVAYRAIFERTLADGSIISSPPITPLGYSSGGTRVDVTPRIGWNGGAYAEVIAGDVIALHRTDQFDTEASVGDVMRLVKRYTITSADISNEYADIKDSVPDLDLGEALYTNQGERGAEKGYYPPPYLRDVVYFNDVFLGIAYQERQSMSFRVPGKWGTLTTDAERITGIGRRAITGDILSGTDTILNATSILGIVVGQEVNSPYFTSSAQVTAASGTTITIDNNATGTATTDAISFDDLMEIDGVEVRAAFAADLFGATNTTDVEPIFGAAARTIGSHTGLEVSLQFGRAAFDEGTFGVRATNGQNYSPPLPEIDETAEVSKDAEQGNRLAWSELGQPEHWPLVNRLTFGEGELVRLVRAGDSVYAFSTDARIYRISGTHDSWRVDQVAENITLVTTGSIATYEGAILAWTDKGLVVIRDGFVQSLSDPRLTDDMKTAYDALVDGSESPPWTWWGTVSFDRFHKELWLIAGGGTEGADQAWIYNVATDEFYRTGGTSVAPTTYDIYTLPTYIESLRTMFIASDGGVVWGLEEFEAHTSTTKQTACTIELNRLDGGSAGTLKQWQEVVLLFAPSAAGSQALALTTVSDKSVGGVTRATSYTAVLDADEPLQFRCHISRATALSAQQRLKIVTSGTPVAWALDGIVVRAEPLVDRTGGRS